MQYGRRRKWALAHSATRTLSLHLQFRETEIIYVVILKIIAQ